MAIEGLTVVMLSGYAWEHHAVTRTGDIMPNINSPVAGELRRLASLKRSRRNLETIQAQIDELKDFAEAASGALKAVHELRGNLDELEGTLGGDDNPLLSWGSAMLDSVVVFRGTLPDIEDDNVADLIEEAEGFAEEYESSLDDSDHDAASREEIWGELDSSLDSIANVLEGT